MRINLDSLMSQFSAAFKMHQENSWDRPLLCQQITRVIRYEHVSLHMIRSELKTTCFICEVCQKEGGQGPRVFIRVEKIKIASLVPNIYGVSLDVILEVHQKKNLMSTNGLDWEKVCLFLAQHRSVYIQFWAMD